MSRIKIKHPVVLLDGNKEIDIFAHEYGGEEFLREASAEGRLGCRNPDCKQPRMAYKHGDVKQRHFSHYDDECDRPGESWSHYAAKTFLGEVLKRDNEVDGYYMDVRVEKFTDVNKPDVFAKRHLCGPLFESKDFAVEVQCSPLKVTYMLDRITANTEHNIYTLYLFDVDSRHFIRSKPSKEEVNWMVTAPEYHLMDDMSELYYFRTDQDTGYINKTQVFGVTFEDIPQKWKLKNIRDSREITNFRVTFKQSVFDLRVVGFE